MERIRSAPRLGDDLYRSLASMIDRRELPEGARLPAEIELASQFGVSRPTVRETLARLRDEGLIASRRGSGSYVQRRPTPVAAPAGPSYRAIDSVEQIKQSYEFRKAVEGEAAFLAAGAHTDALIADVAKAVARLDAAVVERAVGVEADFRFHLSVAAASGNSWFVATLQAMRAQIEVTIDIARTLSLSKSADHLQAVQDEHVAIYEAIRRRDPGAAREAMREHLTKTYDRILSGNDVLIDVQTKY